MTTARFDSAQVFSLGASEPPDARTVALGWPVWAVDVSVTVAARSSIEQLDLFETSVLELCIAGARRVRAIATDLDLDPELILLVVNRLQGAELIGDGLEATARGTAVMDERRIAAEDHHSGVVFVDAWAGRVLPGLHRVLEPLELRGWNHVRISRRTVSLTKVPATRGSPVLEAAELQPAVLNALSEGPRAAASRRNVRGVRAVGAPWPARILIWVYRRLAGPPEHRCLLDRHVRVLDAHGEFDDTELEQAVNELIAAGRIERLRELATAGPELDSGGGAGAHLHRLQQRLRGVQTDHPAVRDLAEAAMLHSDGYEGQAVVALASALETTLRAATSEVSREAARERLGERHHAAEVLAEALRECGFRDHVPQPTVRALRGDTKQALLRPLAALIVLIAADDELHPLRSLAPFSA